MRKVAEKKTEYLWICLGLVCVLLLLLPGFVLGEGSYVQTHDQLDGEVINYIYHAKYLGNSQIIPEFMNGMDGSSMTPPSPLGILFYRFLSPYRAYQWMYAFSVLVAYFGMYFLAAKISGKKLWGAVVAVLFSYLPLYPVYGLSVYGQPMLLLCLWRLWEFGQLSQKDFSKEEVRTRLRDALACILGICLYGAGSSLALVGFVWCMGLGVTVICLLLTGIRRKKLSPLLYMGGGTLALCGTYLLCNVSLVKQLLGLGSRMVSHREEMVLTATNWTDQFKQLFFEGGAYVTAYGTLILFFVAFLYLWEVFGKHQVTKRSLWLKFLPAGMVLLVLFACWWKDGAVPLRTQLGGMMKSFQFDRVYWLMPLLWYVCLALGLGRMEELRGKKHFPEGLCLVLLLCQGLIVLRGSLLNINLRLLLFPNYQRMTWESYYGEDTYRQVEEYLCEQTGLTKEEYRCVSLGIDPACALYAGFYCLDGYSNFYSLSYKHTFRRVIAAEIEKSDYLQFYFDEWGNRCYFFSSELLDDILIPKNSGRSVSDLEIDAQALYDMGGRFVFSAVPIENAQETGLSLLREEPFCGEHSNFEVWLYGVTP